MNRGLVLKSLMFWINCRNVSISWKMRNPIVFGELMFNSRPSTTGSISLAHSTNSPIVSPDILIMEGCAWLFFMFWTTAFAPILGNPRAFTRAFSLVFLKSRGRLFPGLGFRVTVPPTMYPNPNDLIPLRKRQFLSNPAATPIGFSKFMPAIESFNRSSVLLLTVFHNLHTEGFRNADAANLWAVSGGSVKRSGLIIFL